MGYPAGNGLGINSSNIRAGQSRRNIVFGAADFAR
jgi:hypothetical protein